MSFQKIATILKNGEIIDYNLISEQLNKTLVEICNLLQDQNSKLTILKNELDTKATFVEMNEIKAELNQKIDENEKIQNNKNEEIEKSIREIHEKIEETAESINKSIESTKNNIMEDVNNKENDINGEIFITKKLISEINIKIINHDYVITKSVADIAKINKLLESEKDKSLELLSLRIEACEDKINSFVSDQSIDNNKLAMQVEEVSKVTFSMKKDMGNEIHALGVKLNQVRDMIVDAPTFDIESTLDTKSLIRAIQRDSRRIDTFNETINNVKNEHTKLNAICLDLCKKFGEFQVNIQGMVKQNNNQHKEILKKETDNSTFVLDLSKEVDSLATDIKNCVETTFTGISLISTDFLRFTAFLSRTSNRNVPTMDSFDDTLIELKEQADAISSHKERFESKISNHESELNYGIKMQTDFKLPFIHINIPADLNLGDYQLPYVENTGNNLSNASQKYMTSGSSVSILDFEVNNTIDLLRQKVDGFIDDFETYKEKTDTKMDKKADTAVVERLLERHRTTIGKIREKLTDTINLVNNCVKKDEKCKLCSPTPSQPSSCLATINLQRESLPRLSRRGENPHQIIY